MEVTRCFCRSRLKKILFGKDENDVWHLKTIFLDKDSLKITIVRSDISDDTMRVIVNLYIGVDVNSTIKINQGGNRL